MTLLGNTIGSGSDVTSYNLLYPRSGGGVSYSVEPYEAYVRSTGGLQLANYRLAVNRGSYEFFDQSWPKNDNQNNWGRDATNNRIIFFSAKTSGAGTWAQFASGASDAAIDARGAELKAFWDAHPSLTMMAFTLHHEPNGDEVKTGTSGTSNSTQGITYWWRAFERIVTRWTALGVPVWQGTQAGATTTPGMIYAGPNLAGSAQVTGPADYDLWYRNSTTEPWGWGANGIQMACFDMYQGKSGSDGTFRAFPEMAGATSSKVGFVSWSGPKVAQQNALGRVLLRACWEFATDQLDKRWPEPNGWYFGAPAVRDNFISTYWKNQVGLTASSANWFANMTSWCTANPSVFFAIVYWDSSAGTGTRGPHMIDMGAADGPGGYAATQAASWNGWLAALKAPVFSGSAPPPPPPPPPEPGEFTPGAIGLHQRGRMVSP